MSFLSGSHVSFYPQCPTPQLYLFPGCIVPALDSQLRGSANPQLQFPFLPSCFSHKEICKKISFVFFFLDFELKLRCSLLLRSGKGCVIYTVHNEFRHMEEEDFLKIP